MRFRHLKIVFIILFFGYFQKGNCQNFEWLKTLENSHNSQGFSINSTISLPGGGLGILLPFYWSDSRDTLILDSFKIRPPESRSVDYYIALLDSNGKAKKLNWVGKLFATKVSTYSIEEICRDDSGNFYSIAYLDSIGIIGKDTLMASKGRIVFSKFDKNLNYLWSSQTGNSKRINIGYENSISGRSPKNNLFYYKGHIYFLCMSTDTTKIGNTTFNFKAGLTNIYGEINPANGDVLWSSYLYSPVTVGDQFRLTGLVPLKGKLYISGDFGTEALTKRAVVIHKDTFYSPGGFIVETDSLGKYLQRFVIHNGNMFNLNCLETDGVYLNFGGCFRDSLPWGNKKIIPGFPPHFYKNQASFGTEIYSASISTAFKTRWFFRPKMIDTLNIRYQLSGIHFVKFSAGFLYFGGQFFNEILIDSTILIPKSIIWSYGGGLIIFKADTIGNILWATHGDGAAISSMDTRFGSSVYAAGVFHKKIEFGPFKDSTTSTTSDIGRWLTKITDYSITRGQVSSGPYCAGDTIKIPYKLVGVFDSSNYFIAELSNEQGNFDGGQRELGRLKTNKDGMVKGTLPLFQVSTSTQYRIRIRSTSPRIQSYYVTDTLRLLIYSKDKANPGPPETICYGDSIKLSTYGGTKWTWSPKYNMSDSTLRQPIVWPIKTTTYKIIIADSSGCGKPDTAYKLIKVSPPLKTVLAFNDTIVCGNDLNVPYYFTGGDSVNYSFQWYFVSNPTLWFSMKSGKKVLYDTLNYSPSDPLEKLAIVLTDGCTNKPDTSYLIIKQRQAVVIKSSYKDTSLCSGHILKYKATLSGGVSNYLKYQWKDLISNTVLSNSDSLKITSNKTLKIQLIVNEGCELLGDTAEVKVEVKAELKAISNLRDTAICFGQSINYTALATGGDSKNYSYSWILDKKEISTTDHLLLTPAHYTSTLTLILKDNCSLPNDTIKKTITIKPAPKADFTYDLACHRTTTNFTFTGSKPLSPITTSFNWNLNNEANSTLENPSRLFSTTGTKRIIQKVSSSNGCIDTLIKDIVVQFQSTADFTANDVCESDSVNFINKSKDATGYRWRFGDGTISTMQSAKHKYQIASSTTFNVSLVAVVNGGCSDSVVKAVTINENPKSDFTYTQAAGGKVDFKANQASASSYRWLFGNGDSAKVTTQNYSYTYSKSSLYTICLKVINMAGCWSETCKEISITGGISPLTKASGFKIYPNPNNGNFTIEIENPGKDVSIKVFDMMGKLVKTAETIPNKTSYSLDLGVANGIYLVRVSNSRLIWDKRLIISSGEGIKR